jgi:hypothetical protein
VSADTRAVAAALRELAAEVGEAADLIATVTGDWVAHGLAVDDMTDDAAEWDSLTVGALSGRLTALADRLDGAA